MNDLFKEKAKDWDANERRKQLSLAIGGCILQNVELGEEMHVMDLVRVRV